MPQNNIHFCILRFSIQSFISEWIAVLSSDYNRKEKLLSLLYDDYGETDERTGGQTDIVVHSNSNAIKKSIKDCQF